MNPINQSRSSLGRDNFYTKAKHLNTLFQFVKANKEEQFLEYISNLTPEEVDVNIRDDLGNYLVTIAVIMNSPKMVTKLVDIGARLDILDPDGYSIMYYPIKFNNTTIIDILVGYNKKIVGVSLLNLRDSRGAVPLMYAIHYDNKYALQELLSHNADANYQNNNKINALYMAVLKKDVVMVKMLIKHIKNVDIRSRNGATPLHVACNFQLTEIVKVLLEHGASQNIPENEYDFYPIFYSVVQNDIDITKLLIDYGADPNNQDYVGNTIVHYAILNNHFAILDYLMENYDIKKKSFDMYDENTNTRASTEYIIDPNLVNMDGLSIVHIILYSYVEDYDTYLEKLLPLSNLNYQDNEGNTIMHIMAENDTWKKFTHILSRKKINIYIKNRSNKTVLDLISVGNREDFIDMVTNGYFNYLKKHQNGWLLDWQNRCSDKGKNSLDEKTCISHIREAIVTARMSIPQKASKKIIKLNLDDPHMFTTFTGSLLDVIAGFKYLTKKYHKNTGSLFHSNQEYGEELEAYNKSVGIEINPNQHLIHIEIRWIYQRLYFPPDFASILGGLLSRKNIHYIIVPIGIILSNGSHSNCLFYDVRNRILERFEPHGAGYPTQFNYNPNLLDDILYKRWNQTLSLFYKEDVKVKYYQPKSYLPKIGFQTFDNAELKINKNIGDPNGFCTLWCIWYLDHRLSNTDKNLRQIIKGLLYEIKNQNLSFRNVIRNYSKNITDLRDRYLSIINRDINDYNNNRIAPGELRSLLINILTDNAP